jgi:hypothetical protein
VFVVPGPAGSGLIQIPRTARDIEALKARREELQPVAVGGQPALQAAQSVEADRRSHRGKGLRLGSLCRRPTAATRVGHRQHRPALTGASAGTLATTGQPVFFGGLSSKQVVALGVLSIIFIWFPLATALSRRIWKRSAAPAVPPAALTETAQRLERLESSVDAIAIEIERISEGQRFVTKLLAEGQPASMIGPGQRSPQAVAK